MTDIVYRKLRSDIVWGVLSPGSPLRSDELRTSYGVGVSPLREALTRLAAERLVTAVGQRGFRVAPITATDIVDVTETRLVIERAALTRSLREGDLKWERRVVASYHALSRIPIPHDPGSGAEIWANHHKAFHMALLSACGSEWQTDIAGLLFDQAERTRIVRAIEVPDTKLTRDVAIEHKEILEATLDRDVSRAIGALEAHYRATMQQALAAVKKRDANLDA